MMKKETDKTEKIFKIGNLSHRHEF